MDQDLLNDRHATSPQPGDYWHELSEPVCVVLVVDDRFVVICDQTQEVSELHWTWNLAVVRQVPRWNFAAWLHYQFGPVHKCWADVIPGEHMAFVAEYLSQGVGTHPGGFTSTLAPSHAIN